MSTPQSPSPLRPTDSAIDPVLTRAELCALAKVSEDTLRREVRAGKLKMLRLSARRVGFRKSEAERWLQNCVA